MNIAMRYVSPTWRDTMVRVEGMGVYALQRAFLIDWYFVDRTLISDRKYYAPRTSHLAPRTSTLLQIVTSGPTSPYPEIMQGYVHAITTAQHHIYIETPYFLPTEPVLFALKTAAVGGVDVRIIVPMRSDTRFVEWAGRSYLREMADAGVGVWLYRDGFIHSKTMVVDDTLSTCGSTNIDFRSFENNFESNIFVYDSATATRFHELFMDDLRHAVRLDDMPARRHPSFFNRLLEGLARLLAPLF